MSFQEIAVILIALGAVFYLIRFMRNSVKEHDCSNCGIAKTVEKKSSSE